MEYKSANRSVTGASIPELFLSKNPEKNNICSKKKRGIWTNLLRNFPFQEIIKNWL